MRDWVATVVALAAFGFSVLNWHLARQRDKRDLFLAMHDRLVATDIQEGRRLLHLRERTPQEVNEMRAAGTDEYHLINRALATFDILAMYVERGYIDGDVVLEEWGHSLARAYQQAQTFIENRVANQTWKPWPHLRSFGPIAVQWHNENA